MAATIAKENLDERIERIKKRNEEIEKKYREAEEDRLMALKDNAMVEIKPPKDEDWPRGHKYDKIDFTYDVKPEKLEELNKTIEKNSDEIKTKRDYKKFADGEGPPPDPAYNFLADAERDGIDLNQKKDCKNIDKKDSRQNNNNNKNKDQQNKRGGPNNGSFRGRGNKNHSPKYQKQNSQPEYEQWRNEREKIDEARINRQKIGEGKWKREWDNDKLNSENEALLNPERITLGDALNVTKKSPTHGAKTNINSGGHHLNSADILVEKRGNITVSVSQTGEVKSVKLTTAPAIGTGRVGPRQLSKPQFSIQTIEKEVTTHTPKSPKPIFKNHQNNINSNNIQKNSNQIVKRQPHQQHPSNIINTNNTVNQTTNQLKNKPKQQPPKYVPQLTGAISPTSLTINSKLTCPIIADLTSQSAIDLSHKPEFAKKSVQDRLLRVLQNTNSNKQDTGGAVEGSNTNNITDDLKNISIDENEVTNKYDDQKTNCDKTNESIQNVEPIAACN